MATPVTPKRIQLALVNRLKKITAANGYPLTVKNVDIARKQISFTFDAAECPYIEVMLTTSSFDRGANGEVTCRETYALRLVKDAEATDFDMHEFSSAVWQCLFCDKFGGQPFAGGVGLNDGISNTVVDMIPESVDTDIGILDQNRIWVLAVTLISVRYVWNL
jgi:hypothetical protein